MPTIVQLSPYDAQVYPDALPLHHQAAAGQKSKLDEVRSRLFGNWSFDDLVQQPAPRLVSTHLGSTMLPATLIDPVQGKGRLVVVLRNLKDCLTSLHFFNGKCALDIPSISLSLSLPVRQRTRPRLHS